MLSGGMWMDVASWGRRLSKSHCRHTFGIPYSTSVSRTVWGIFSSASQKEIKALCTVESHIVAFHDQQFFSVNISSWSVSISNNTNNTNGMTVAFLLFTARLRRYLHPLSPVDGLFGENWERFSAILDVIPPYGNHMKFQTQKNTAKQRSARGFVQKANLSSLITSLACWEYESRAAALHYRVAITASRGFATWRAVDCHLLCSHTGWIVEAFPTTPLGKR